MSLKISWKVNSFRPIPSTNINLHFSHFIYTKREGSTHSVQAKGLSMQICMLGSDLYDLLWKIKLYFGTILLTRALSWNELLG